MKPNAWRWIMMERLVQKVKSLILNCEMRMADVFDGFVVNTRL
jgi:hypothetical protein